MGDVRNLQEQVLYLTEELKKIKQSLGGALPSPIPGPQGPQGSTGERGPKGEEGVGIKGFGSELPPSARLGEWFILQANDDKGINFFLCQYINYRWVRQFSIRGPQGIPGPQGGSDIVVNPVDEATGIITKIKIDGVVYTIDVPTDIYPENVFVADEFEFVNNNGYFGTIATAKINAMITAYGYATTTVVNAIGSRVTSIESLIPLDASEDNELADKDFVNSSIATNTAFFIGTFDSSDLGLGSNPDVGDVAAKLDELYPSATNNDYAFFEYTPTEGAIEYWRFKFVSNSGWEYEYMLNNSSFTQAQWNAINSGITATSYTNLLSTVANKEDKGYITIGGTRYQLQIGDTPSAGTITFELED